MDRSSWLTLGGAALVAASTVTLAVLVFGGEDEAPPLPEEVASAPVAPSQAPDDRAVPPAAPPPAPSEGEVLAPDDELSGEPDVPPADEPREADPDAIEPDPAPPAARDRSRPDPRAARPPLAFCFPGVIPTPDGCASRETILSFAGEPIGVEGRDGAVAALTVTLADPGDPAAPEREVGTCDDYLPLKRRGWQALTGADLSRDLRMNRFCGLIAMARRAERPVRGGLTRLTYGGLETVPGEDWPSLGEASLTDPAIALDGDDDRVWRVEDDGLTVTLRDVGAADLDGDGESEVLVHAGVAARGGTARGGGYLLAEGRRGGAVRLTPPDLYGRETP